MTRYLLLSIGLLLNAACSHTNLAKQESEYTAIEPLFNFSLFDLRVSQNNSYDKFFKLSPQQEANILAAVQIKELQGFKRHEALYEVLQERLDNFTYYGETYSAETSMRLNQGNCMSLAVLTTAYAKLLGLDFSYREVNTLPIFSKKNNLILSSSHVQTIIYDAEFTTQPGQLFLQKPGLVIDYFPSKNNRSGKYLDEDAFIAMYYQNLAGDALVDNNLDKAFLLASKAYTFDQDNIDVINSLAIIHRRAGDNESAEAIYLAGLKKEQSSLSLLSNYVMLLKSQNREAEAEHYQSQLSQLNDPNPFHWLEEAYIAEQNHETNKAKHFYLKALKQAPYLHQAYLGLYHIYRQKGQYVKAKNMMRKALEWTYEVEQRKQYKYKLYSVAKL